MSSDGLRARVVPFAPAEHGEPVTELMRLHAAFERADPLPDDLLARTVTAVDADQVRIWVALLEDRTVGYVAVTRDYSTWRGRGFWHMDCLFVHGDHRGLGIGALLVRHLTGVAREHGVEELQWQTPAWNTRALAFYRRLGASAAAKQRLTLSISPALSGPAAPGVPDRQFSASP